MSRKRRWRARRYPPAGCDGRAAIWRRMRRVPRSLRRKAGVAPASRRARSAVEFIVFNRSRSTPAGTPARSSMSGDQRRLVDFSHPGRTDQRLERELVDGLSVTIKCAGASRCVPTWLLMRNSETVATSVERRICTGASPGQTGSRSEKGNVISIRHDESTIAPLYHFSP